MGVASARQSYVHGIGSRPLSGETIGACFDRTVARRREATALVVPHQDVRWSFGELATRVDALARGLLAAGLEPGDRVGIWAPNCAEWIVVQYATAKAGLVLVNINPAYRSPELEHALRQVGCRALLLVPSFKTSDYVAMLEELVPELKTSRPGKLDCERLPELRLVVQLEGVDSPGMLSYARLASLGGDAERRRLESLEREIQFDDPVNIQFTSGTTGRAKAATLTHHNILNNALSVAEAMAFGEEDRLCIPVPMYHCFGMVLGSLVCVASGATMVLPAAGFEAGAVLEAVARERCTALHGVPTMFIAELEHPELESFDLTSLRTGIMAGAPCPVELMKRVVADLHLTEITIAYGMTETSPVSFQTSVDDSLERRVTTVGRVLPHIEVKLIDDQGRIVERGAPGELLTRGYSVMRGYWGDAELTAEAIDDSGWLHSGDVAVLDDEGYCNIVGRTKDLVIRGGENIFPREIEELLYQHPLIEEVEVFGVPDIRYGEEVCAWIKLREGEELTEEEVREFCRGKLAHFKIPRYVRFVERFPMTVTGKVQKFRLRQAMVEELELEEARTA